MTAASDFCLPQLKGHAHRGMEFAPREKLAYRTVSNFVTMKHARQSAAKNVSCTYTLARAFAFPYSHIFTLPDADMRKIRAVSGVRQATSHAKAQCHSITRG